jgi:hypothetical protein
MLYVSPLVIPELALTTINYALTRQPVMCKDSSNIGVESMMHMCCSLSYVYLCYSLHGSTGQTSITLWGSMPMSPFSSDPQNKLPPPSCEAEEGVEEGSEHLRTKRSSHCHTDAARNPLR